MENKTKVSYVDTESFTVSIKAEEIYKQISKGVETRLDISNYELQRSLPKGKNKKIVGLMKDELRAKMMIGFIS